MRIINLKITPLLIISTVFFLQPTALSMNGINPLSNNYPSPITITKAITAHLAQNRLVHDPELTPNSIKILFPDDQKLMIDKKTANKFIFFRDVLDFANAAGQKIISLPKTIPSCINKQTMAQMLSKNKDRLTKEDVINCYQAAEFFGADDEIFYRLSECYLKIVPRAQRGDEFEMFKNHLGIKHYYDKNYSFERSYKCSDFEIYASRHAYKYKGVIYTLSDLDYLGYALESKGIVLQNVKKLVLSDHELSRFNIKKIIALFPSLRSLDLSTNAIRELDLENLSHMPENFTLSLKDNPLTTIKTSPIKKWPKNCTILVSKSDNKTFNKELKKLGEQLNMSARYKKIHFLCLGAQITMFAFVTVLSQNKLKKLIVKSLFLALGGLNPIIALYAAFKSITTQSADNKIVIE